MDHTYLLTDGTVGTASGKEMEPGTKITVELHDENGMPITKTGIIEEVID